MDSETRTRISETVLEILNSADMDTMTEFKVRQSASEKLGINLSDLEGKKLVRSVVESYLAEQHEKGKKEEGNHGKEEDVEEEEESDQKKVGSGEDGSGKEYDEDGDLIICRLNKKRRVTITEFRGKTLLSIREYYWKDGKECPSSKGISLTAEQWVSFKKNLPAIEDAIKKIEARVD
ncbi:unnamed protein product [Cuscuta epithymum]|uniref:DEK-C domain-containing protein n=2 Tax=Cuscuta epithymum TaxID=186058 RepID=A0AAV0F9I2_9ASTE|nr:unnamed protein product [Cuscuta epithymum]